MRDEGKREAAARRDIMVVLIYQLFLVFKNFCERLDSDVPSVENPREDDIISRVQDFE